MSIEKRENNWLQKVQSVAMSGIIAAQMSMNFTPKAEAFQELTIAKVNKTELIQTLISQNRSSLTPEQLEVIKKEKKERVMREVAKLFLQQEQQTSTSLNLKEKQQALKNIIKYHPELLEKLSDKKNWFVSVTSQRGDQMIYDFEYSNGRLVTKKVRTGGLHESLMSGEYKAHIGAMRVDSAAFLDGLLQKLADAYKAQTGSTDNLSNISTKKLINFSPDEEREYVLSDAYKVIRFLKWFKQQDKKEIVKIVGIPLYSLNKDLSSNIDYGNSEINIQDRIGSSKDIKGQIERHEWRNSDPSIGVDGKVVPGNGCLREHTPSFVGTLSQYYNMLYDGLIERFGEDITQYNSDPVYATKPNNLLLDYYTIMLPNGSKLKP